MTTSDHSTDCAWFLERVDAFLDNDLPTKEAARFRTHVEACPACSDEFSLAETTVSALRALPTLEAPGSVLDGLAEEIGAGKTSLGERLRGWFDRWVSAPMRPAMTALVLVIVVVGALVIARQQQTPQTASQEYSEEELEMAKLDAMVALAYFGKYTKQAGYIVRDDVIGERMVVPLRKAISAPQGGGTKSNNPKREC